MKTFIYTAILTAGLLFSVQADAANERELAPVRSSILANGATNVSNELVLRGEKITITPTSGLDADGCRTFREKVVKTDRRSGNEIVYSDLTRDACLTPHGWLIVGSSEYQRYKADLNRNSRNIGDDGCLGNDRYRSESRVATAARRELKNATRGKGFDILPVAGEALIGVFLVDRRSTKNCRS